MIIMGKKNWLLYAFITTIFWGIWGAFIEIPEKAGFPATLGYVVWAFTMLPCALLALYANKWKLNKDKRAVILGALVGLFGAGGQLMLFEALRSGPAYIVFPLVSLFPILTVILSIVFLKERASAKHWAGIIVSLIAIFLLSYQPASNNTVQTIGWLFLAILVFVLWGLQAFVMKFATTTMNAESVFFYMMCTAVLLIPVAVLMTDFTHPINTGLKGPYLAAGIHVLNSIGALTLVYALRFGKAIIVVPMTGLSPLITIVISLLLYGLVPGLVLIAGVIFAMIGIFLLSE